MTAPSKLRGHIGGGSHVAPQAFALAVLMLGALLVGFAYELYWGPLDDMACSVLNVIVAFAGGFSAYFMGGAIEYSTRRKGKALRMVGGVAVFMLLYSNPPFSTRTRQMTSITIDEVCGAPASSKKILSTSDCGAKGSVRGLDPGTQVCAELDGGDEMCTLPVDGAWSLGPFDLRAPGQTSAQDVELRIVARDFRKLHRELVTATKSIQVQAPTVSVASVVASPFCVTGRATNLRTDEGIVLEATPVAGAPGTWYLPASFTGNDWSACDQADLRVPAAPRYQLAIWLGVGVPHQRLSALPPGYTMLKSYAVDISSYAPASETIAVYERGPNR